MCLDLAYRTPASPRGADVAKYRDEQRLAGKAENAIRLKLQIVSHLYEIARKEWGAEGLLNSLSNIRKPTGSQARDRRFRRGEFEKLRALLSSSGNPWVAPAFELAIETSLRQGTLFSIRREWLDVENRLVKFPPDASGADKKGVPAALPLSKRATNVLRNLATIAEGADVMMARSLYGHPTPASPE